MKIYVVSCTECGFSKSGTRLRYLKVGVTKHSCERQRAISDSAYRNLHRYDHVDRTPKPCVHKKANHQHGTKACYAHDKCRCLPCAGAVAAYEDERNRKQAYGRWDNLVDAEPVRAHLRWLQSQGMGYKTVAANAGVAVNACGDLYYGKRGKPVKRVRKETAEKILAVRPELHLLGQKVSIDSTGTVRRLRALVVNGWSMKRLGEQVGWSNANIHRLIVHGSFNVGGGTSPKTALAVRSLYERLWDVPPPESTWHQKAAATRARNLARSRLWLGPQWWDEDTIDDPAFVPETEFQLRGQTDGVRVENAEFLRENGMSLEAIQVRLGCSKDALMKSYERDGKKWPYNPQEKIA